MLVSLTLNGARLTEDVRPDMTLFDFCRAHGAKSVKCACETSNCGLCTVLLDGEPVLSCSVLMARADGHDVTTLEGVRDFCDGQIARYKMPKDILLKDAFPRSGTGKIQKNVLRTEV